jgi:hypothetical protein
MWDGISGWFFWRKLLLVQFLYLHFQEVTSWKPTAGWAEAERKLGIHDHQTSALSPWCHAAYTWWACVCKKHGSGTAQDHSAWTWKGTSESCCLPPKHQHPWDSELRDGLIRDWFVKTCTGMGEGSWWLAILDSYSEDTGKTWKPSA